eukprot:TRINITY_DN74472_c0_g1_i1.p1 TRINITY_DN74472_c0_g1~~TRINITY_DN74472_c0_g1_i1.p1  ORF type:complete len:456 (+),score=29.86 TRINITY_DN74472_c0_g1_i1:182-1549(+)
MDKYAEASASLDRAKLLRCICHVGAWVALLPEKDVIACVGASGRSPIKLLTQLLQMRGRGKMTEWMRGALQLVSRRASKHTLNESARSAWAELRRCLPTGLKSVPKSPVLRSSCASERFARKRLVLFEKELQLWSHIDDQQKAVRLRALEEQYGKLSSCEHLDPIQLRLFLRQVAAAISSPRALSAHDTGVPMDVFASESLRHASARQHSLRRMLTWALTAWREAFQDEQIEPILDHIRDFVTKFELMHGTISCACSAKQWRRLKAASEGRTNPSDADSVARVRRKHNEYQRRLTTKSSQRDGVYTPAAEVIAYPYVSQGPSIDLQCTVCAGIVTSCWYAKCGTRYGDKKRVIVPLNGHAGCKGSRLKPPRDILKVNDDKSITFCSHGKCVSRCALCGGRDICVHQRLRFNCRVCSACEHGTLRRLCLLCADFRSRKRLACTRAEDENQINQSKI